MNKIFLIGYLTRKPELITTKSGVSMTKFDIAVNSPLEKNKETADFFTITAFKNIAENCCKFLTKGSRIAVSGSVHTGSYVNSDGKKIKTFDIMTNEIEFLTKASDHLEGKVDKKYSNLEFTPLTRDQVEDLPF